MTGTWIHRGTNLIGIALSGVIYNGVLSRQWNTNANRFVVTFRVQAAHGVSWWCARSGD